MHAGADAFAPQLLAGHFHDEGFEIQAGQVFAYMPQAVRQILAHTILSVPWTFGFEVGPAEHRISAGSNPLLFLWN
jgi:hypothetical protein